MLPEQLRVNGGLVPPLAALIECAAEYYATILDAAVNPLAEYLPGNPMAWQTFVATPAFQLRLTDVEAAAAAVAGVVCRANGAREQGGGPELNGGPERNGVQEQNEAPPPKEEVVVVDVKAEARALCKFIWSNILQVKAGGEELTLAGVLARIGCEVRGKQAVAAEKFAWVAGWGEGGGGAGRWGPEPAARTGTEAGLWSAKDDHAPIG